MSDNIVKKAENFAIKAHSRINQRRKYSLEPYDVHLRDVANLLSQITDDKDIIAAAWLHDIVEDTPITHEEIEKEFGREISKLIIELTDITKPSDGNRKTRKNIELKRLATISKRAKTIKLADLIDNATDISIHDPKFAIVFLSEMEEMLKVLEGGEPALFQKAKNTLELCKKQIYNPRKEIIKSNFNIHETKSELFSNLHGIRFFTEAFTACDIMEPLFSFDYQTIIAENFDIMNLKNISVIGIRNNGIIDGYLELTEDSLKLDEKNYKKFIPHQILDIKAPLVDIIHVLTHFSFLFIKIHGSVIGVITRTDIEKPVVRMWLFGMIILIEMLVVKAIKKTWTDESWFSLISEGRLEKARQLFLEKQRRNLNCDLIDCLQFADKMQLIIRTDDFLESTGFQSVKSARKVFKELEILRNNLAHGQEINKTDWPSIVRLTRRINEMFNEF